eukprot:XP_011675694.1 PREDICTED: uncharacterized protein LOC105443788 [Strongylocentrotus purpuratus]
MPSTRSGKSRRALAKKDPPPNPSPPASESDEGNESTRVTTPQPSEPTLEKAIKRQPSNQPCPKRKKTPALHLSEEQEQDVADWYRSHELLYNRRMKEYKQANMKTRLYEEKAASLDPPCTAKQLKVWIDSMRTSVGKLTKKKSGQEAKEYTDRERWILENFGYLTDHIKRVGSEKRKQGGQVCLGIRHLNLLITAII